MKIKLNKILSDMTGKLGNVSAQHRPSGLALIRAVGPYSKSKKDRSNAQLAHWTKYANAITEWKSLSATEKSAYADPTSYLPAYQNFMKQKLQTLEPATGGVITRDGDYYIHTFLTNGTFVVTDELTIEYLIVAGGGGGGWGLGGGGGGGGGGLLYDAAHTIAAQSYQIVIGAGGAGGAGSGSTFTNASEIGENSSYDTLIATGGGRGGDGANTTTGGNGGSGGGGGYSNGNSGSGIIGQGHDGANATGDNGGGGGGADGAGSGMNGGIGNTYESITYATGGDGGDNTLSVGGATGNPNSGGGGGGGNGGYAQGGNGGSGIVIIRYIL